MGESNYDKICRHHLSRRWSHSAILWPCGNTAPLSSDLLYFLVMGLESVSTFTVDFLLTKSWALDFIAKTFLTQITLSHVILTNSQEPRSSLLKVARCLGAFLFFSFFIFFFFFWIVEPFFPLV